MKVSMCFDFNAPTRVVFGVDSLKTFYQRITLGHRVLLVASSERIADEKGCLSRIQEQLRNANVSWTMCNVSAITTVSDVMRGAALARDEKPDFILAVGGGGVIGCAKAIAFMSANTGNIWDYVKTGSGKGLCGNDNALPVMVVSTTASTGAEVNSWCVLFNEATKEKAYFGGFISMIPKVAVIDPDLMISVNPKYTACQGFDALFHGVECYIAKTANLMSHTLVIPAVKKIAHYLPRMVINGNDVEARLHVAFSSISIGYCIEGVGCGSLHALECQLTSSYPEIPHGAAMIMLSKAYFEKIISNYVCDERFVEIAEAMGAGDVTQPIDFISCLEQLKQECSVADLCMSDYGVNPSLFVSMAKNACAMMGNVFNSDMFELAEADCCKIYEDSFK